MKKIIKKLQDHRDEWIESTWQDWLSSPVVSRWTPQQQKKLLQGLANHLLQDVKSTDPARRGALCRYCRQNIQRRGDEKPEIGLQLNLLTRLRLHVDRFVDEQVGVISNEFHTILQEIFDSALLTISEVWGDVLRQERRQDLELIEQLKRVKNDLQQQVNVHYQMIRESPVATMNCDAELLVTHWNPMATRMTGYQPSEMLRQSVLHLFGVNSRDLFLQRIRSKSERISRLHLNIVKKSGETALALVSVSRIKYPYPDHLFYIISLQDLSAHEQLSSKSKKIDQLLTLSRITGAMMHDIRNPINTIGLYADLLSEKLAGQGSSDFKRENLELLDKITGQIDQVSHHLNHYLAYQHLAELHFSAVDIDINLRSMAEEMNFEASLKKIQILYTSRRSAWILADWPQLKRAFMNILQNSLQAIGENGQIQIDLRIERSRLIIRIRDNGPGIAASDLQHIFEPFFTTKSNGEGLGLFITRELIRASGGRIRCWSRPGRGTVFSISFPIVDQGRVE
ncbi:PAS domain S-box protein [candidate division KSB1 bacterium]|nr:PAS domain S-box protein [candidate division KSB1 bacterium]